MGHRSTGRPHSRGLERQQEYSVATGASSLRLWPSPCLPGWMSCLSNLFSASWLLLTSFCVFLPECTAHLSAHLTFSLPSRDDLTWGRSCRATSSAPGRFEDFCLNFASVAGFLFLLLCSERQDQVLSKYGSRFRTPAAALLGGSCVCSKKIFTNKENVCDTFLSGQSSL